jgi:ParB-like nuclease domain
MSGQRPTSGHKRYGAPPELAWVPIDQIHVDHEYQRGIGRRGQTHITKIAETFEWRFFQPISLARRCDGTLYAVDGQHRLMALRRMGDIGHAPCLIFDADKKADEARAFTIQNKARRAITNIDALRAALAGGDAIAQEMMTLMRAEGFDIPPHTNTSEHKPHHLACICARTAPRRWRARSAGWLLSFRTASRCANQHSQRWGLLRPSRPPC